MTSLGIAGCGERQAPSARVEPPRFAAPHWCKPYPLPKLSRSVSWPKNYERMTAAAVYANATIDECRGWINQQAKP